ncbi:MAG TPA: hypothetical protein VLI93_00185 [Acetobacteraceae bacterium]|nr:hypothetical protein [Acetobacteraceae bacterium]
MATGPVLITGFEPYGGRGHNPAAEIARALDGSRVAQIPMVGRTLPVSHAGLHARLSGLVAELTPRVVLSVGLWPGEPAIRIERFAVNLADFEIPDNDGHRPTDQALSPGGSVALAATVPVRQIEAAMLAAGIPARLSNTAGTFLCNACLFAALQAAAAASPPPLCGFIHVPYLPVQVAEMLDRNRQESRLELHQRADLASMDLDTMIRAVRIAADIAARAAHAS